MQRRNSQVARRSLVDISVSAHYGITMRTTVKLADDVYQAAKTLADGSGEPLGVVLSDLARKGLQPRSTEPGQGGLPVFAVPSNSEIIPGSRAAELLASEGVE